MKILIQEAGPHSLWLHQYTPQLLKEEAREMGAEGIGGRTDHGGQVSFFRGSDFISGIVGSHWGILSRGDLCFRGDCGCVGGADGRDANLEMGRPFRCCH